MAQTRQELEEYQNAMVACLTEEGVQAEVVIGGAVVATHEGNDPALAQLDLAALDACAPPRVEVPSFWMAPADEAAYERMLDVRDCIVAHGYEPGEPPSAEVWIQEIASGGVGWGPYELLVGGPGVPGISGDELRPLMEECPQSGHGMRFVSNNW